MAEGRTVRYYVSDTLTVYNSAGVGKPAQFKVHVPNNLSAQTRLGWQDVDATLPSNIGIPNGLKPRHVVGRGSNGKVYRAVVGSVDADIWTRVESTWTIVDNFGGTITVTRTGLVSEYSSG